MSYSIRDAAMKHIKSAKGNADTAMTHLLWIVETYKAEHPEIAADAEKVMTIFLTAQEACEMLRLSF